MMLTGLACALDDQVDVQLGSLIKVSGSMLAFEINNKSELPVKVYTCLNVQYSNSMELVERTMFDLSRPADICMAINFIGPPANDISDMVIIQGPGLPVKEIAPGKTVTVGFVPTVDLVKAALHAKTAKIYLLFHHKIIFSAEAPDLLMKLQANK
jgi:hypothetical protein